MDSDASQSLPPILREAFDVDTPETLRGYFAKWEAAAPLKELSDEECEILQQYGRLTDYALSWCCSRTGSGLSDSVKIATGTNHPGAVVLLVIYSRIESLKYHAEGGWGQQAKELDQVESLDRAICLVLEAVEGGGWALLEEELRELQHENLTARPDLEELDEAAREAALLRGFPYKRGWPGNAREAAAEAVVLAERAQKGGKQRWVKDIRAMFLALANDSDDPKEVPTLEQLRRWAVSLRKTLEK